MLWLIHYIVYVIRLYGFTLRFSVLIDIFMEQIFINKITIISYAVINYSESQIHSTNIMKLKQ